MRRACTLVLTLSSLLMLQACTQNQAKAPVDEEQMMQTETRDYLVTPEGSGTNTIMMTRRNNASRLSANDQDEKRIILESEITMRASIPERQVLTCQATVRLSFDQRNTVARVDGDIQHEACPASSGEFEVQVSFRDAAGDMQRQSFSETWQREHGESLAFTRDYRMGEETSLSQVTARNIRCSCGVPAQAAETE
jgi:hypothetical protein